MLRLKGFIAAGLLLAAADAHAAYWTTLTSATNAPAFNALAVFTPSPGSAAIAAVGDHGNFMYSNDGVGWTSLQVTANSLNLRGVASNDTGSTFVIVGDAGTVIYSPDYIRWTTQPGAVPGNANLRSVTFGHGLFVAGGDKGTLITSTNGFTWTPAVSGTTESVVSIVWTGTVFVAALQGGPQVFLTSSDGVTWTPSALPVVYGADSFTINSLHWTGTQVLAAGSHQSGSDSGATLLVSNDGLNWAVADAGLTGVAFTDVAYLGGGFLPAYVAVTAGGGTYGSSYGNTWSTLDSSSASFNAVLADGSYLYAVGPDQTIAYAALIPAVSGSGGGSGGSGVTICITSAGCGSSSTPSSVGVTLGTTPYIIPSVISAPLSASIVASPATSNSSTSSASASSSPSSSSGGGAFGLLSLFPLLLALRRRVASH